MAVDTAGVDRALGAIGTTFRLTRLYPPSHPAVMEALRQIGDALPVLAALGTVEWKIGATGLHWHGQQLLPRNSQITELAGLLYARGVRMITLNPGMTADHVLALFGVAMGTIQPDDAALGRIALALGRRGSHRLERLRTATPAAGVSAVVVPAPPAAPPPATPAVAAAAQPAVAPGAHDSAVRRSGAVFRPDVLPIDVVIKRAVASLGSAATLEEQRATVEQLRALAPQLLGLHDTGPVAEAIAALDHLLTTAQDPALLAAIDQTALALSDRPLVERMVRRLGEPRVPPEEREMLVAAVGALAAVSVPLVLDAFLASAVELRPPYRAAIRTAADRALEPLQGRLADEQAPIAAAAAELVGLTGSPQAVALLLPLVHHPSEPAMPALKDESVLVRVAAARAIAAGGDPASSTVLIRRLEQEPDEGVLAELLRAIGRLGAMEALEVLARYAEPGGMRHRRSATVRAAAIEGLRHVARPEARGLLELYSKDKEPAVRKAAEAALR